MKPALLQTDCPKLNLKARGKVRDIYDLGEYLLLVASDRISTFDVVFPNGVPDKGRVLTQISRFWFEQAKDVTANHVVSFDVADFPAAAQEYADQFKGRSLLCKKATPLTIECVVRGYLDGSAWAEYQKNNGRVASGHDLPAGSNSAAACPSRSSPRPRRNPKGTTSTSPRPPRPTWSGTTCSRSPVRAVSRSTSLPTSSFSPRGSRCATRSSSSAFSRTAPSS
jgi:hypothetical protein